MLTVKLTRFDPVLVFAAEEMKKYLRMMMPREDEITISLEKEPDDGFRLGLLEDFGLSTEEVEDPLLDDVVHIDTDEKGGILAGSNPRSVLFAVYRYLRLNGCRWLYPGVDGDFVPVRQITAQRYHKKADHRFRGHCNEGAESQTCMLETIDFYAKQEINIYMIEFDNPYYYYDIYYRHKYNEANRESEPASEAQVMQWKRECEAEIAKRGLMFHDMGHGWTAEPFGIASTAGWRPTENHLTQEQKSYLAEIGGVREPFHGVPLNTNLCYSNPQVRSIMADGIVQYAKNHRNVDYLHVWLADAKHNHCECEACRELPPSDFYLMIMNELDEKLTREGLDTRIVFIAYVDTMFPPERVSIQNPERFSLLYAPITRSYSSSIQKDSVIPEPRPYLRNAWKVPRSAEENYAYLKAWQKNWKGPSFSYEYHFWKHQYRDVGGITIARRIFEDILALKDMGLDGFVEDGSQRSFFPNGFAIYVYAETLLNRSITWEELAEDYFSHLYGKEWKKIYDLLEKLGNTFDFSFMSGERSKDPKKSAFFDPEKKALPEAVRQLCEKEVSLAEGLSPETRPEFVSKRLLLLHAQYASALSQIVALKATGQDREAYLAAREFFYDFGQYEIEIERYFDHCLAMSGVDRMVGRPKSSTTN